MVGTSRCGVRAAQRGVHPVILSEVKRSRKTSNFFDFPPSLPSGAASAQNDKARAFRARFPPEIFARNSGERTRLACFGWRLASHF
jgi:hypothetical protein